MHRGCASIASTVLRGRKGIAIHTCYNGKEHTGAHGFYTTSISTFPRQGRRWQRGGFPHNLRNTGQVMSVAIIAIRKFRWKNILYALCAHRYSSCEIIYRVRDKATGKPGRHHRRRRHHVEAHLTLEFFRIFFNQASESF